MAASEQYKLLLEEHLPLINKGACEPMNKVREEAIKTFLQYGIPSQKEELFRHIDIEKIYNVNPLIFYSILNLFTGMQYRPMWPSFSHKTEFVHLPDREKIHTPHILQP